MAVGYTANVKCRSTHPRVTHPVVKVRGQHLCDLPGFHKNSRQFLFLSCLFAKSSISVLKVQTGNIPFCIPLSIASAKCKDVVIVCFSFICFPLSSWVLDPPATESVQFTTAKHQNWKVNFGGIAQQNLHPEFPFHGKRTFQHGCQSSTDFRGHLISFFTLCHFADKGSEVKVKGQNNRSFLVVGPHLCRQVPSATWRRRPDLLAPTNDFHVGTHIYRHNKMIAKSSSRDVRIPEDMTYPEFSSAFSIGCSVLFSSNEQNIA